MAKRLTKALRGKRRWIGFRFTGFERRDQLSEHLTGIDARLFDMEGDLAIVCVHLENYPAARKHLSQEPFESLTSSGKITCVRERLGLARPERKR
jgi:hypothetical protein